MGRFNKQAKSGFMQMSNDPYRDKNLSWAEMGLLGFLMSCSDSFEISVRGLAACNRMGVDATATALNNLIEAGYVTRREVREKGKFIRVEYDYSDYIRTTPAKDSDTDEPYPNAPYTGNPYTVKPDNKNNQYKEISTERINNRREGADAKASAPTPSKKSNFQKPTVEEIQAYLDEKDIVGIDAEYFWNFYEAKGWMVGKSPMKNWKACIATWQKRNSTKGSNYADSSRNEDESDIPNLDWLYDEWKTVGQDDS